MTKNKPDKRTISAYTYTENSLGQRSFVRSTGEVFGQWSYDTSREVIIKGNTITLYDDFNAIAQYTNATIPVLTETYAWGLDLSNSIFQGAGGVGGLLDSTDYKAQIPLISYPCYDGNGNITEYLIEADNGVLAAHYEYSPFGKVEKKVATKEYSYQFSTKPFNVHTGLNYYNYRDYDSGSGRWVNRDPIGESGGENLYEFIGNDAISYYDYVGLEKKCVVEKFKITDKWGGGKEVSDGGTITVRKPFKELPKLGAAFEVDMEFGKPDCKCCEMRQEVKTEKKAKNSPLENLEPGQFHEDRDDKGGRYGHRNSPAQPGFDAYYDINPKNGKRIPNQENGKNYNSTDNPTHSNDGETWTFRVYIIDTCNDNKEIKSKTFSITWTIK